MEIEILNLENAIQSTRGHLVLAQSWKQDKLCESLESLLRAYDQRKETVSDQLGMLYFLTDFLHQIKFVLALVSLVVEKCWKKIFDIILDGEIKS